MQREAFGVQSHGLLDQGHRYARPSDLQQGPRVGLKYIDVVGTSLKVLLRPLQGFLQIYALIFTEHRVFPVDIPTVPLMLLVRLQNDLSYPIGTLRLAARSIEIG